MGEAEDKGNIQQSWSKRNLFAIFVLIPLIIGLLALLAWSMANGFNVMEASPIPGWTSLASSTRSLFSNPFDDKVNSKTFDVDVLIDKILANDKFNELVTARNFETSDFEKLMLFATAELESMEQKLKEGNEVSLKEMNEKIDNAQSHLLQDLKHSSTSNQDLKTELENLKLIIDQRIMDDDKPA